MKLIHEKQKRTDEEFKNIVLEIGNNEYTVLSKYNGANESIKFQHKVCGHTFHVRANHFINGSRCPRCRESKGEKCIGKYLNDNNILHEAQYRFKDCRNKKPLPFDFAIFDNDGNLTMLIEYDGELHYQSIEHFGGDEKIHQQIENDQIKNQYCRDNNIKLYRIPYWKFNEIEEILDKLIHNKPIEVDETSFSIL